MYLQPPCLHLLFLNSLIPMKTLINMIISLLFLPLIFLNAKAQNPATIPHDPSPDPNTFQPSLVVVIGILAIMFSLTFFLLLYAKFCHRASILNATLTIPEALLGSWRRSSGIDKTVVESLPFFRFSSLQGSRDGLECAVCLSRFEDIEILRLLPKCKHAFHIHCIDQWLEKHSTCPLCRHKVCAEDLSLMNFSSSLRFLWSSQSDLREESSLGLYIQREESFKFGSRKIKKDEKLLPIQIQHQNTSDNDDQSLQKPLHHLNHRIIVSDVVLKNRWSSVSSSDLMALTSELIRDAASHRFSSSSLANPEFSSSFGSKQPEDEIQTMSIKEEIERKRLFEIKVNKHNQNPSFPIPTTSAEAIMASESATKSLTQNEKRSMSEIVVHPRFRNGNLQDYCDVVSDERRRKLWLPIARRTVQWFAKRERRSADESQIPIKQHNP
ncbi:putative RING-H2 finger protein ATL12 [Ipomoea triloba]|uniref:putative RING-H2 finger protein ATL12 n=1 Tax=Ipomoea triloba TaxID=35885 RepID=UPI00125E4F11|nr:putative RING-H2 finger protein ATL12 [Ipomoea triloba]